MTHAEWCHWGVCAEPNHCTCGYEDDYWDKRRQAAYDLRDIGAVEEVLEKVHGQDPQKRYSVGEVKSLIYPLIELIRSQDEQG